jgi:hypothetical protein
MSKLMSDLFLSSCDVDKEAVEEELSIINHRWEALNGSLRIVSTNWRTQFNKWKISAIYLKAPCMHELFLRPSYTLDEVNRIGQSLI